MRSNMFQVAEKFVSINGEGRRAGQLAVFIRFCGCNLDCTYCDTKWANTMLKPHEILDEKQIVQLYMIYLIPLEGPRHYGLAAS